MRDWPTLALMALCYLVWTVSVVWLPQVSLPLSVILTGLAVALHASLQHEVLHGHPFADPRVNEALVFPSLNLAIPYARFRDTHLAHHRDALLTDPYDDPESNYVDPLVWEALPAPLRLILSANNTLAGRLLLGPMISQVAFMRADWQAIRDGDAAVLRGWLWHLPAAGVVVAFLAAVGGMPWWAYGLSAYIGLSILKLRTFLEHQAHESARGRTVVIEDRGLFALLFLNNNFHVVHHMHPRVPWYRLPRLFAENRDKYLQRNRGYYYRSYSEVIRRHLLRAKDPVAHPLWRGDRRLTPLPSRAARRISGRLPGSQSEPSS